jgi:branched-chain amino acid transport system substrate-binding protein
VKIFLGEEKKEEKVAPSRRGYLKTVGAGIVGLAVGAAIGYGAAPKAAPGAVTTITKTETITATAPAGKKTITIGALVCTSGSAAAFGEEEKNAFEVALDHVNRELEGAGSSIRFEIISADTGTTAEGALKALTSLVETRGIKAIVGPGNSIEVGGIKAYCDANKIVSVAMSSSEEYSVKDYIFRPFVTNKLTAKPIAKLMWSEGKRKVACIYRDDSFGRSLNDYTKREFEKLGGVWKEIKYMIDLPDYSSEVAALSAAVKELGADEETAVFHVTFETDGLNIYGHAATDPVLSKVKWYGTTDSKRDAFLPPAAPIAIGDFLVKVDSTGLFPVNPLSKINREFAEAYKAKTGKSPSGWATYFYDDVWILCLSLLETEGKFGEILWKTIPKVAERYTGASGPTPLDENGDLAKSDFGVWHVTKVNNTYKFEYIKYYSATTGEFGPWVPEAFMG